MADGVLFVLLNDFPAVTGLVSRGCIDYDGYLVFYLDEEPVAVRFSLDKLYGVANQFH